MVSEWLIGARIYCYVCGDGSDDENLCSKDCMFVKYCFRDGNEG